MLTRAMAKQLSAFLAHECLFVDFLSEEEPKKVSKALKHPGWVDAMQDELNQFAKNKVWTFVPAPYGKTIIGSRWQEGMDYDDTFAPVARLEAIRIFFAFTTYMNFIVYQIDVKSVFINGFDLKGYTDSDYAGCNMDRKSTSSACRGKLVCWSAKKQQSVVMSSTEAEYVAAASCCANILWMKSQFTDYDIIYEKVPNFYDNTSVIAISNNPVLHSRTKHIDINSYSSENISPKGH
ncbi:retrovirus-related pol polyprotein from transposon TNT 1-94 [Tanacetum coccineum]